MWLLGIELRTFRRTVSALNCWAISPAPRMVLQRIFTLGSLAYIFYNRFCFVLLYFMCECFVCTLCGHWVHVSEVTRRGPQSPWNLDNWESLDGCWDFLCLCVFCLVWFGLSFFFFFQDKASLCSPVCPETCCVDQTGLKLRDPPAFASHVLRLKVCNHSLAGC